MNRFFFWKIPPPTQVGCWGGGTGMSMNCCPISVWGGKVLHLGTCQFFHCVCERELEICRIYTTTPLSRFPKKMVPEAPCLLCASWSVCVCRGEGRLGVRRKLSCLMIQGNLRECSPPLPSLKWRHSSEDSVEEPHSHSQQFPVRWRVHRKGLRLNRCSKWRLLSCSHVVEKYRNQAKSN